MAVMQYIMDGTVYTMRQIEKLYGVDGSKLRRVAAVRNTTIQAILDQPELWDEEVESALEEPPYTIRGTVYESFDDVAKACFCDPKPLRKKIMRYYAGRVSYGLEDIYNAGFLIFKYQDKIWSNTLYTIGYPYFKITSYVPEKAYASVVRYINRGMTLEEAKAEYDKNISSYVVLGVPYKNQTQYLKSIGISNATWAERVRKLGSVDAAARYYQAKVATEYKVGDKTYTSQRQVYYALGLTIGYTSFNEYVRENGMDAAIKHYAKVGKAGAAAIIERYTVGDKKDLGIKEAAELAHTAATTLRKRSEETGKSIQTLLDESYAAFMIDPPPYYVGKVKCRNATEAAKTIGVSLAMLQKRREALGTMKAAIADCLTFVADRELRKDAEKYSKELNISREIYMRLFNEFGTHEAVLKWGRKYPRCLLYRLPLYWREIETMECIINGERYYILEDIADALHIKLQVLYDRRYKMQESTMQEVVDSLQSSHPNGSENGVNINHRTMSAEYFSVRGNKIQRHKTVKGAAFAYSDGQEPVLYCICPVCERVMLLHNSEVAVFKHSDACEKLALPPGLHVPTSILIQTKYKHDYITL